MLGTVRGGFLRPLVAGWVTLVMLVTAGTIWYVIWGGVPVGRTDRAQVSGTLLTAIAMLPPTLLWAWSRRRPNVMGVSTPRQIDAAADALAMQMLRTWSRQAGEQGIHAPAPLRVRWQWAAHSFGPTRQALHSSRSLASDPYPLPLSTGAGGEVLGSGLVTRLHEEVYARLRHGRLVLIGGPGTGKTGAMILLLLQALRHRKRVPDADRVLVPVPVWLTLGSWNPKDQELREWVTATMARDHPYLRAVDFGPDAIGALFDAGRIALFLDGLDEMPGTVRGRAIRRLQGEAAGLRMVLTSRSEEYCATLAAGGHPPHTAVIQMRPVGPRAAAEFLLEDQFGADAAAWSHVCDRLRTDPHGVLARALDTPLMLSLARAAYNGHDSTRLLVTELGSEEAIRRHLLDQVLITAYPDTAEREHATRWLSWIAGHMGTGRDLRWWDIPAYIPRWQRRLALGLMLGFGVGLGVGPILGLELGLVGGFLFGLIPAIVPGLPAVPYALDLRWPTRRELRHLLARALVGGLALGLISGPVSRLVFGLVFGWEFGWEFVLAVGLVSASMAGFMQGFAGLIEVWREPAATAQAVSPREVYQSDRRVALAVGLLIGAAFAVVGALSAGLLLGPLIGLEAGLASGLVFGLVLGLVGALLAGLAAAGPAVHVVVVELVWWLRGESVRFLPLLEAALERQVLRQAGAVYQFRHAELQDRLAARSPSWSRND